MSELRPTPEEMLARVKSEGADNSALPQRGRLKLFFGYAAGVGKTYSMLQAARALKAESKDVVAGYIEPHGRAETQVLLEGIECLPLVDVPYRGTTLWEFDLDAALERKPQLILVDELAHTNAPGMRHSKRWQDVEELLASGIDVFTTVNVQHVESLNDVISQISGVTIRETFPDEMLSRAHDVALVDLPPDELLERLRQGKVYIPQQAARALEKFFRKENLVALRELALRQTADRVHEDVQTARMAVSPTTPWPTSERLVVCVGPSPTSAKVIRAAKRLADRLSAEWLAVHVETARAEVISAEDRERLVKHLRLAESLGAEVAQISGDDVVGALIDYAGKRNVTKIVVGKTDPPRRSLFFRQQSLVDRLVRDSGTIDVVVVRGVDKPVSVAVQPEHKPPSVQPWIGTGISLALATLVALAFSALGFNEASLVMTYLLAVVFVGTRYGALPSAVASVLSVLLFDVLFTEPLYAFTVDDTQYLVTFSVMLGVGLLISTLTARIHRQTVVARRNERRTEALYRLSRRLTALSGIQRLVEEAERAVAEVFDAHAVLFLPDDQRKIRPILSHPASFAASASEFAAAQWVFEHNQPAGMGTDTLPSAQAFYLPLTTPNGTVGVLAMQPEDPGTIQLPESRHLAETYATQIAFAIERDKLAEESQRGRVQMETEKLRSALLSAVSHDLRTPLAGIAGAASGLARSFDSLPQETRRELLETICDESDRLSRLVENLLNMTRLSSGTITVNKQWQPVEEVIGSALNRMESLLKGRTIDVEISEDLPLGQFDAVLVEQALINLLDNAVKYSPPATPVLIRAESVDDGIALEVSDRGSGLKPGDEERIFEMFYRAADSQSDHRGTGLGLAICKAIVTAHGGTIWAANRTGGGATVRFDLPNDGTPPDVVIDQHIEATQK